MDLLLAVAQNNIERTRHLLQAGIDVNYPIPWTSKNTYSPVLPTEVVSRPDLLAKLQSNQEYHTRALNIAVLAGHAEMVRLLLNAGADINMKDGLGRTALICAIFGLDMVASDINTSNLHLVSQTHNTHLSIIKKMLLRHPSLYVATLNSPQHELNGITPLCLASYLGKSEIIELLLEDGRVDVNGTDSKCASALMYAARDGNLPTVQMLLSYDASPDTTDSHGWSAIQYAENNPDIVQLFEETLRKKRPDISMIHAPVNPIARYPVSHTNLSTLISSLPICQSSFSHLEFTTLQEIDSMDPITTPIVHLVQTAFLHSIKSHDHVSLQKLLLWSPPTKRRCNWFSGALLINHHDPETGMTAIHHTMRAKPLPSLDTIAMLYQAGIDINAQTCYGRTALHHLARIGMDKNGKSWGIQKKSTKYSLSSPSTAAAGPQQSSRMHTNSSSPFQHPTSIHSEQGNQTNVTSSDQPSPTSTSFFTHRLSTLSTNSFRSNGSDTAPIASMADVLQEPAIKPILAAPTIPAHLGLCASLLIKLGALVNIADPTGNTPLHFAAEFGAVTEVLEALIMDGNADLHVKNKKQQKPLDICKTNEIRMFMLALDMERTATCRKNVADHTSNQISNSSNTQPLDTSIDHHNSVARHMPESTTQSAMTTKSATFAIMLTPFSEVTAARNKYVKKKTDACDQITLDFETILNSFLTYHTTTTYSIEKALAYTTKSTLQLWNDGGKTLCSTNSSRHASMTRSSWGYEGGSLEQIIVRLRFELQQAHSMFGQVERRVERVMLLYGEKLTQVEISQQADWELLMLQKDKIEKLFGVLEQIDGRLCGLEGNQNELIGQVEYRRRLALRQLRWLEQNGGGVNYDESMHPLCLENVMQSLTILSTIPTTNDSTLYLREGPIKLFRDIDYIMQKLLQQIPPSCRLSNARTSLEEKWHQVESLFRKPSPSLPQKNYDIETSPMTATTLSSKSSAYWRQRQTLTDSFYAATLAPTHKHDHRSLNELELAFEILSTNLCEIQKDMDDLGTQSIHVMASKKRMYDACLVLENELEILENTQQKRSTTTTTVSLDRTPIIVRDELDQVIQRTQTLFDRQCFLDQEATTLKKEYNNIEHQLNGIKEALRQVRPPLLLQGLLEQLDIQDEPIVRVEKGWLEDENLAATTTTLMEDPLEHHQQIDLTDESNSTSLSSTSSIFSSRHNDKTRKSSKNNNNNVSNSEVTPATQLKNTFKTPLAIQCLLTRLDISLYTLKVLTSYHLRRSRQSLLEMQVSLGQAKEDVDDACDQMNTLYEGASKVAQRVFDFKTEMGTVIQHRKEEIVKIWEVVDELSKGIDTTGATQNHHQQILSPSTREKGDSSRSPPPSAKQQRQGSVSVMDKNGNGGQIRQRQQLILRGLKQFQVSHKHLQDDVEALKRNQAALDQRIRHANALLIEPQVNRLMNQDDNGSSLLSVCDYLTELMDGIRLHDLGLNLDENKGGITILSANDTDHRLSSTSRNNNTKNPSTSLDTNRPPDQLSTIDVISSRRLPDSTANNQRISLALTMRAPLDQKRTSVMSTTTTNFSSLSSYQQKRMLSRASSLRQALDRKMFSS